MFYRVICISLIVFASFASAEQKKVLGDWDVHYIAFNTTFLTPEIARANGIVRSPNNTLINISVINRQNDQAQKVDISGTARNLLGTTIELTFKPVVEGEAIYYLASMPFEHEDHYRFNISLQQNKVQQTLKFEQKLYREEQ
ncbi:MULTISPECIES: DUF4426 domain-containing protein [Aliiglaciecola]|uniref:DUF4426 domain-containing protein n=1 Tax=Aliiglaciecola TaxID=1406885 RepID=UPI001C0A4431|nr:MULTISPECIES: DUF4426 domain-containing protein [Aliiglaciecola]MBU2876592.1 DUF4426 domain-containing protein [Aliiglaciecola lipolytica]MDO6711473.1 DUF4426 domain-containing protein [Aliiglaciecola sp. 2_MG-2023]MDO6752550.1 DUF4426 domain-containing protein [Aliiglaciecola sp. 1_MG-2023]